MSGYSHWTHSSQERDPRKRNMAWRTPPSSAGRTRADYMEQIYDSQGYDNYSRTNRQRHTDEPDRFSSYSQSSNPGRDVWDSRPPVRPQSASAIGRTERNYIRRNSGLDRIPESSIQETYNAPVYRTTFEETYLVPKEPANKHMSPDRPWTAGPRISTKDFEMHKDRVQMDSYPDDHHYKQWHHYHY